MYFRLIKRENEEPQASLYDYTAHAERMRAQMQKMANKITQDSIEALGISGEQIMEAESMPDGADKDKYLESLGMQHVQLTNALYIEPIQRGEDEDEGVSVVLAKKCKF